MTISKLALFCTFIFHSVYCSTTYHFISLSFRDKCDVCCPPGGDAVVLSRGDMGDHGTMFKMVPETTYEFANRVTCFKIDGADGAAVMAQPALPDPTQYKVGYIH